MEVSNLKLLLLGIYLMVSNGAAGVMAQIPSLSPTGRVSVGEHNQFTFTCTYTSTTPPKLTWVKDGDDSFFVARVYGCKEFSADPPGYTEDCSVDGDTYTYTLNILNVTRADEGQSWRCMITVGDKILSGTANITVAVGIQSIDLTRPSQTTVTVIENREQIFECKTSKGRPEARVKWYLDSQTASAADDEITTGVTTTSIEEDGLLVTTGQLKYRPGRDVNGWKVYCTGSNVQGQTKISSHKPILNVHFPPTILSLSNQSVVEAGRLSVSCAVTPGNPSQTSYKWTRSTGRSWSRTGSTLTIDPVQKSDDAIYTCTARNTMGTETKEFGTNTDQFILDVLYPPRTPTFTMQGTSVSDTVKVIRNTAVALQCTSDSNPAPDKYTWLYPDSLTLNSQILNIGAIQKTNAGSYQCTAENSMSPTETSSPQPGANSSRITVNVLFSPTTPNLMYGSLTGSSISNDFLKVVKADSVIIACEASGNPGPHYKWSSQSAYSQILTVNNIEADTTSICTATNTMVPTVGGQTLGSSSTTVTVSVMYGPTEPILKYFYTDTSSMVVPTPLKMILGNPCHVTCSGSNSKPDSSYSWTGNVTSPTGSFRIASVNKAHAGTYSCKVHNRMIRTFGEDETGTYNKTMSLDVLFPPTIMSLSDQSVEAAGRLSVSCTVTPGKPTQTSYRWTRSTGSSWSRTDITLTIDPVQKSDDATYTCTAWNSMKPTGGVRQNGEVTEQFSLNVVYKASITSFKVTDHTGISPYTVEENSRVTFFCDVDSNPGSTITLTKDGVQKETQSGTKQLTRVFNATCLDAGLYSCTAFNEYNVNGVRPSQSVQLYVKCSPRTSNQITENVTKALEETAVLTLTVVAYPVPASSGFVWSKYSGSQWTDLSSMSNIHISSTSLQSNLTINSITESDYGEYQLTVDNGVGSPLSQQFRIIPLGKPKQPSGFHPIEETIADSSVTVEWKSEFDGGLPQTFYIQYKKVADIDWTEAIVTDTARGAVINYTITGLSSSTKYEVRIYASNAIGNSSKVESQTLTTLDTPAVGTKTNAGLIAGTVGGPLGVILIVIIVIVVVKKRNFTPGKGKHDVELNNRNINEGADNDSDDEVITENATYDSAGPRPQDNPTAGPSNQDNTYAIVNKHNKPLIAPNNTDVYAEVKKPQKKNNVPDIYALPVKKKEDKAQVKPKPKEKEKKKPKDDKNKKKDGGKQKKGGGDVYENAPASAIGGAYDENPYENPEDSIPKQPKRNVNKDGLVYADLSFKPDPKGQGKLVIHGLDDMTEYVQVDFTKKAEPLPDSDEEDQNANTKK